MTVKQLLYYVTIAETGSFTTAAERLNLSQPPLSKQMMLLEKELNVQLLIRSSRKIRLTEAGSVLYGRAKDILKMMDCAAAELSHVSGGINGTLRLGVISSASNAMLHGRLSRFSQSCPNVTFDIHEDNSYALLDQLRNGLIDAAVIRTPFNAEGLECLFLPADPLVVAGKGHFFAGKPEGPLPIDCLLGVPLIYCRSYDSLITSAFERSGIPPQFFCKNDDTRTSMLMANSGMGVAIVPESVAQLLVRDEDMCIRALDAPDAASCIAFVYKQDGYVSKAARKLAEYFR